MSNKVEISKKVYERFKLKWMIDHGFTVADICDLADTYASEEVDPDVRKEMPFAEFLEEQGLGNGSLWPCYNEFLEAEYLMPSCIAPLLNGNEENEEYAQDLAALLSKV